MLFGKRRKNEISVRYWQETELRLAAFSDSLAPQRARTHRNLGLNHLIPGTLGILTGVDETHQPGLLIVLEEIISDWKDYRQYQTDRHRVLPPETGQKNTDQQNRNVSE